jgi:uncharacterized protein
MIRDSLLKQVGNWVDGERFWDREIELELFKDSLSEGNHILLVAQRRIGKTSLMREAARHMSESYFCLQVDLQNANSAADAVAKLSVATREHKSLWDKAKELFANITQAIAKNLDTLQLSDLEVTLRASLTENDWQPKGDRLLAILAAAERPVVIFLDEVPILVNRLLVGDDYQITPEGRKRTDQFMSWLRAGSQAHQGKLRFVVTGSIGLESVLHRAGLSATINHFTPFELGPWSPEVAQACLQALSKRYNLVFQAGAKEAVVEQLGVCIPYHVQLYFDAIYQICRFKKLQSISSELVVEVYQTRMLSVKGHAELSHLEERLKLVLGGERYPLALEFLTEAAVTGQLTSQATAVLCQESLIAEPEEATREILSILEHDGYLHRNGQAYQFVSKLVKDWWQTHYGWNYKAALERGGEL